MNSIFSALDEITEYNSFLYVGPSNDEGINKDLPKFALIGIGDFGEAVVDNCISRKLFGIDYYVVNSTDLANPKGVSVYTDERDDLQLVEDSEVKNTTVNNSISDVNLLLEGKDYVFIAVNVECLNSISVVDLYVEIAKSLNCFVIVEAVIPIVESDAIEQSAENIAEVLGKADAIIDIPNYSNVGSDEGNPYFYRWDVSLFAGAIACVTQVIHGDSLLSIERVELDSFLKKSKYIRLLMPTIRKNDVEIAGDVSDSLEEWYPEFDGQQEDVNPNVLALIDVPEERSTLDVFRIACRSIEGLLPSIELYSSMIIRPNEDILGEAYILLGSKDIDLELLLKREDRYAIDKNKCSVRMKKNRMGIAQHMNKFSYSREQADSDLARVYPLMRDIYSTEEHVIDALNRYSECYRYGVVVDTKYVNAINI